MNISLSYLRRVYRRNRPPTGEGGWGVSDETSKHFLHRKVARSSSNASHFFSKLSANIWLSLATSTKVREIWPPLWQKNSAEVWQNFAKCWSNVHQQTAQQIVNAHFEIRGRSMGSALCRSRRELLPPRQNFYLQHLASRQPRPSPPTFCRSKASDTHHPRS